MAKKADLHVHTSASNGKIRPEEAVRLAEEAGLAAIAIVDHDTVSGIEPAISATELYEVEVLPGVELSYEEGSREVHIIGYLIDWRDFALVRRLRELQNARRRRMSRILDKLAKAGVDVSTHQVLREAREENVIGRLHIARALVRLGHVKSINEAFNQYLGYGKPAYVEKFQLSLGELFKLVRDADGVPALAHPKFGNAEELVPQLASWGLRGIETIHPEHEPEEVKRFKKLAKKYGLIEVGGSDIHGVELGFGSVTVPYDVVEKLKSEGGKPVPF